MPRFGPKGQRRLFPEDILKMDPVSVDETFRGMGFQILAGVDEAGRGPLAGPVVAAAVILPKGAAVKGLTDSKALRPDQRERLFDVIHGQALSLGLGIVEAEEIDRINILRASLRAMKEAVDRLGLRPDALLIDGPMGIGHKIPQFPLVKGDARSHSIAAASVIAKVTRDRIMARYHELFPQYGFKAHKGYATSEHLKALRKHGCSPVHRKTFRGVKEQVNHAPQISPSAEAPPR